MIKQIIHFFRLVLGLENIEEYGKPPKNSHVNHKSAPKKVKSSSPTGKMNVSSSIKRKETVYIISKPKLMRKIKTNIFFLEQLLEVLENQAEYRSYYRKVREMKIQSEGTFKVVHRIREDAPYCQNTLKTILKHTNTIAQLLEVK